MRRGAILLLALSLVLVSCRISATETTVAAEEPAAASLFPVAIETDLGQVSIASEPSKVVSLSATATEMLYAVGAGGQVVATDLTSNFPAEADATMKIDSFNFNAEEVAALDPDLVVLAFDFQGETEALAALGIPFLLLGPPADLESALSQLLNVGLATGHPEEAASLTSGLAAEVDALVAAAGPLRGTTIYHEVDEALYSASSASFIGDIYYRLGLVNIADGVESAGPFPQLSAEFIVDQDPEFIFLADANFGVTTESVADRPGWATIAAVDNGNVIGLDGDIAGRWGPRTMDLMRSIFEAVEEGLS